MKGFKMLVDRALSVRNVLRVAVALVVVGQGVLFASSTPFGRMVVFGDSTSDIGNCYALSGGTYPPSPPYWEGHFCNGPMWAEYLAQDMGMAGLLDDYAVVGAATGHENSSVPAFGGVQDQVTAYLSSHTVDPDALYVIWAGHNDIFIALATSANPETVIGNGVANTLQIVQDLWDKGAHHILVFNVADLGMTPTIGQWGAAVSASVSAFCMAYNQALEAALAAAAIPTIRLDVFAANRAIVASASELGFSNVTDSYLAVGAGEDPAQYVFWDDAHTTTHVNRLVADAARNCLIDYYSPRNGRSHPPALVNALNGLVHADKGK